jgi:hypothetical protein
MHVNAVSLRCLVATVKATLPQWPVERQLHTGEGGMWWDWSGEETAARPVRAC